VREGDRRSLFSVPFHHIVGDALAFGEREKPRVAALSSTPLYVSVLNSCK